MSRLISKDSPAARSLRARLEEDVASGGLALPLLPESARQVLATCQSDACDARGLAELIQKDATLATHVLRVANSAAYAPVEPIVSLQQAVSRLGMGSLCGIAVSVVAKGQVFHLPGHERRLRRLWRHSALTAAWCREIARLRRRNVEGAFLSGLLHDLGKPIVLAALSGLEELGGLSLEPELLEEWLVEMHPEVGASLLASWDLPLWVQEAAGHHHDPGGATMFAEEANTVCIGDQPAHGSESGDDAWLDDLRGHEALQALGLYMDEIEELLERKTFVEEIAQVFL